MEALELFRQDHQKVKAALPTAKGTDDKKQKQLVTEIKTELETHARIEEAERFKQQMRDSLRQETLNSRAVTIPRRANIYACGDQDEMVYFIESGQIKLLLLSPEGKECLLAIHSGGDIFGELCLAGFAARHETATRCLRDSCAIWRCALRTNSRSSPIW